MSALVVTTTVMALLASLLTSASAQAIAYGEPADRSQTPWFVRIESEMPNPNGGTYTAQCGGSVIAKRWILTAAHCVRNSSGLDAGVDKVVTYINPSNTSSESNKVTIESYTIHPGYQTPGAGYRHDLAVLKTTSDINSQALPIVASGDTLPANSMLDVFGMGEDENGQETFILHTARLQERFSQANGMCGVWDPKSYDNSTMICATRIKTSTTSFDACSGDSGGPLTVGAGTGRKLVGVVSWGQGRCGIVDYPGVYVRLSAYSNWINQTTGVGTNPAQNNGKPTDSGKAKSKPKPAKLTTFRPFKGKYKKLKRNKKLTITLKNPGGLVGTWTIKPGAVGKVRKGKLAAGKTLKVTFKLKSKVKKCTKVKVLFGKKTILTFKVGLNGRKCS